MRETNTNLIDLIDLIDLTTPEAAEPIGVAAGHVATLLAHPGPYISVYLAGAPAGQRSRDDILRRWAPQRAQLDAAEAPTAALDAIDDRLLSPMPEDIGSIGVIAAADGTAVVDHGLRAPARELAVIESLPYLAPMFEMEQQRRTRIEVCLDAYGATVSTWVSGRVVHASPMRAPHAALAVYAAAEADRVGADLITVDAPVGVVDALATTVGLVGSPSVKVVSRRRDVDVIDLNEMPTVKRGSQHGPPELRFERKNRRPIERTTTTVAALIRGVPGTLVVHDHPSDPRRVWVGACPTEMSITVQPTLRTNARLVDAAICAAVHNGDDVHVVPPARTGPAGRGPASGRDPRRTPRLDELVELLFA